MKFHIIVSHFVLLSVCYDAKPTKLGSVCSNPVNCFVDPCQVSHCDAYPNAQCVSNYCDGCNALWYLNNELLDDCSTPIVKQSVEKDCQIVNCFVDPCSFAKCMKHPEAVCHSNYCGGCYAWFYLGDKRIDCN